MCEIPVPLIMLPYFPCQKFVNLLPLIDPVELGSARERERERERERKKKNVLIYRNETN